MGKNDPTNKTRSYSERGIGLFRQASMPAAKRSKAQGLPFHLDTGSCIVPAKQIEGDAPCLPASTTCFLLFWRRSALPS